MRYFLCMLVLTELERVFLSIGFCRRSKTATPVTGLVTGLGGGGLFAPLNIWPSPISKLLTRLLPRQPQPQCLHPSAVAYFSFLRCSKAISRLMSTSLTRAYA